MGDSFYIDMMDANTPSAYIQLPPPPALCLHPLTCLHPLSCPALPFVSTQADDEEPDSNDERYEGNDYPEEEEEEDDDDGSEIGDDARYRLLRENLEDDYDHVNDPDPVHDQDDDGRRSGSGRVRFSGVDGDGGGGDGGEGGGIDGDGGGVDGDGMGVGMDDGNPGRQPPPTSSSSSSSSSRKKGSKRAVVGFSSQSVRGGRHNTPSQCTLFNAMHLI